MLTLSIWQRFVRLIHECNSNPDQERIMTRLRVDNFAISLDGYGAGPDQSLQNPLGKRGEELHRWFYGTRTFQTMFGNGEGSAGIDDQFAARGMSNVGAWILGRNMFTPSRGAWPDDGWKGWWGANPPYHVPVFVVTHHARKPLEMEGGTTFYFVTDGIESALRQARAAAGDKDVRVGGGTNLIRQYLQAGLIDSMHLVQSPTLLGGGENLLQGLDLLALGYSVKEAVPSPHAMHVVMEK
jgi:dihydrofolate reductase